MYAPAHRDAMISDDGHALPCVDPQGRLTGVRTVRALSCGRPESSLDAA